MKEEWKKQRTANRASWNKQTPHNVASAFYDVDGFLEGKTSLNSIELEVLGDIKGASVLHLQCHFGLDTLSLGRMGARVTGMDLSNKAIEQAQHLSKQSAVDATFICCDLYDLPKHLDTTFDVIFTTYGTIAWLPDLDAWAAIISRFLAPGGRFIFAEFHPVVWMFDNDFAKVAYRYFNSDPIIETESGTYADRNADLHQEYTTWNHGIGEVITSLQKHALQLQSFQEFDYSPYDCFRHTVEFEPGKFRIAHLGNKIPMVYRLVAVKEA